MSIINEATAHKSTHDQILTVKPEPRPPVTPGCTVYQIYVITDSEAGFILEFTVERPFKDAFHVVLIRNTWIASETSVIECLLG